MFLVKAMYSNCQFVAGKDRYTVWQCDHYSIRPPREGEAGSGPQPQLYVDLWERANSPLDPNAPFVTVYLGHGEDHYADTVYIMNDRGKTIDTVNATYETKGRA